MKQLSVLNKYFVKYKWRFILGIVFVAAANYFRAWQPQVIGKALDHVLAQFKLYNVATGPEQEMLVAELGQSLFYFGGLVLLLALAMGVFMYFMRQTIIVMSRLIEYDMRTEIFAHYEKLDLAFFRKNKTGDLMARITEDVNKVRMYLGPAVLYGINLATLFVMVIYSMFRVNVELSLYTLLPLPILSLSIYYVSNIIHRKSAVIQKQLAKLNSIAQEVYSGIRVVKSYVQEGQFKKYFADESEDYKEKTLELAKVNALFFPIMMILIGISTILVIYVGGLQAARGEVTPGNIAEFVIYVNMLTWPVTAIGWIASLVQQAEASQQRINEFLNTEPAIQNSVLMHGELRGDIEFRNVTFTYPGTGITALQNVSFRIEPGQRVALMGRTASGKSTIADLMTRMYDVDEGQILIDGIDVRDHDLGNLRQKIGFVPQDVFLFSDTIEDNILFGTGEDKRPLVQDYAKTAAIHDEIAGLPDGYDTMVGERGVTLSGGQKQRVSIARALIKNPDIIIFDDSLSAVDTNTEQQIVEHLDRVLHNKTSLIITHRISAIEYDQIIVLENGRVVEIGRHGDLIEANGVYTALVHRQMRMDALTPPN